MRHRPDLEELLVDYASGGLSPAPALLVAAHLSLNAESREAARRLETLGGMLLETADPVALGPGARPTAEALAERMPSVPAGGSPAADLAPARAVDTLRRALAGEGDALPWKRIVPGVYDLKLDVEDDYATSLLRIRRNSRIAEHTHSGVEMTLVISGAFDDGFGEYGRGGLCIMDPDGTHQPTARGEADCICLAVTEGPLRFTGPLMRLLNPFLR